MTNLIAIFGSDTPANIGISVAILAVIALLWLLGWRLPRQLFLQYQYSKLGIQKSSQNVPRQSPVKKITEITQEMVCHVLNENKDALKPHEVVIAFIKNQGKKFEAPMAFISVADPTLDSEKKYEKILSYTYTLKNKAFIKGKVGRTSDGTWEPTRQLL